MDESRSQDSVTYRCTFDVVRCPKCRRLVLAGDIDTRLKEIIRQVCASKDAPILALETMPDRVHLPVVCDPKYGIHRLVKAIKVVQAAPAPGVRHAAVAAPNTVDQLILRRDRWRLNPGGLSRAMSRTNETSKRVRQ